MRPNPRIIGIVFYIGNNGQSLGPVLSRTYSFHVRSRHKNLSSAPTPLHPLNLSGIYSKVNGMVELS
jgi:hypothetical protein